MYRIEQTAPASHQERGRPALYSERTDAEDLARLTVRSLHAEYLRLVIPRGGDHDGSIPEKEEKRKETQR